MSEWANIENWYQEVGALPYRYLNIWKQLWNWVTGRGWNSLEGSEEDRQMRESLELASHLFNSCDHNTDSDTDSEV